MAWLAEPELHDLDAMPACCRGAGTDANVFIELHGDKGSVGRTRLDNATNNFERGRRDEFTVTATDVGSLQHIVIGHDGSGEQAGGALSVLQPVQAA